MISRSTVSVSIFADGGNHQRPENRFIAQYTNLCVRLTNATRWVRVALVEFMPQPIPPPKVCVAEYRKPKTIRRPCGYRTVTGRPLPYRTGRRSIPPGRKHRDSASERGVPDNQAGMGVEGRKRHVVIVTVLQDRRGAGRSPGTSGFRKVSLPRPAAPRTQCGPVFPAGLARRPHGPAGS